MIDSSILGSLKRGRQQSKPTLEIEAVVLDDGFTTLHQTGAEGCGVFPILNLTDL
jgi:hypothetical protein